MLPVNCSYDFENVLFQKHKAGFQFIVHGMLSSKIKILLNESCFLAQIIR